MSAVEGWITTEFGKVANLVKGISYASEDYCGPGEGAVFITIKCISKAGGFKKEGIKYFKGMIAPSQVLQPGELLVANTDLTRAGDIIGCPMLVPTINGETITMSMDLSKIEDDNTKIDRNFLYYKLMTDFVRRYMKDHASGSTVLHLQTRAVPSLELEIPTSIHEQAKIAEILSIVDQAIEQTEALIAKQKRLKIGLLQDLLSRGIDEQGNIRSEETHEFKDSPLGRIPIEWEVKQLSTIVDLKVGYAFKSSWFSEDGTRLLRGENVGVGHPDWKETRYLPLKMANRFKEYQLNVGDMIIGMDRTFTKLGFKISLLSEDDVPCLLVQRVGCFNPMNIPRGFMQLLIQSQNYQRELQLQQKGMDIPHLSKSEILSPLVSIPINSDEMNTISSIIEMAQSTEWKTTHHLNKLRSLKTALMQDLLTGKTRVTSLLKETEAIA